MDSLLQRRQSDLLPQVHQLTLKQLYQQRQINFNKMLQLPFLLKDPSLENRKDTIAIFKKRKFESLNKNNLKPQLINNGRIHLSELWSEKYQSITLKNSKINKDLEKYRQDIKSNIKDFLYRYDNHSKLQFDNARNHNYTEPLKEQDSEMETDRIERKNQTLESTILQTEGDTNQFTKRNQELLKKPYMRYLNKDSNKQLKQNLIIRLEDMMKDCEETKQRYQSQKRLDMRRESQFSLAKKFLLNNNTNKSSSRSIF